MATQAPNGNSFEGYSFLLLSDGLEDSGRTAALGEFRSEILMRQGKVCALCGTCRPMGLLVDF